MEPRMTRMILGPVKIKSMNYGASHDLSIDNGHFLIRNSHFRFLSLARIAPRIDEKVTVVGVFVEKCRKNASVQAVSTSNYPTTNDLRYYVYLILSFILLFIRISFITIIYSSSLFCGRMILCDNQQHPSSLSFFIHNKQPFPPVILFCAGLLLGTSNEITHWFRRYAETLLVSLYAVAVAVVVEIVVVIGGTIHVCRIPIELGSHEFLR